MKKISLIKIKEESTKTKIYFMNFLILKINFKKDRIKYYLFGILIYSKKKKYRQINAHLSTKNFNPLNIDDFAILSELQKLDDFLYIPNPGNMGDMLIAAATITFFDKNNIKYHLTPNQSEKYIVYGGGGVWTADYKKFWLKKISFFAHAEKVVILPSSFNKCPEFINVLDKRYVVFCREKQSYDYLTSFKSDAKIILDHDMALRMDQDILKKDIMVSQSEIRTIKNIKSAMCGLPQTVRLLREDCESLNKYKTDMDLSSFIHGNEYSSKEYIFFLLKLC